MTLRQEWIDDRLAFGKMSQYKNFGLNSITLTEQERIWKPDLFFRNEKEGHFHKIIMPNVLLRINGEGQVLYSIRISLVLACPMDLKYYPLDKQNCTIEMASYGYLDEDLKFIWKEKDPVQIAQPLNLPRFTLETYETAYCTSRTTTGAYSCLRIDLIFKREFSYYLIQIYIPCCMLVIVSWVSFWLDPNAIPARVSLGVTTLLTMATQISGINASLPPVSYTKAIDVWTGVCLTFVFSALLEFALVNYASRSDQHKREMLTSALTHTQKMRWRDANAAAAAAGVAPPTSPPPDDNSPSAMENKHLAFFGGPLGYHHQNNPQMSTSNPQRVVAGSSSMTNPLIPGHHAGSVQYHAQAQDPMLQGSLMTSYSTNGHAAGSTTRMRGPSNSHPIVTVEAGLGASMAAGAACPMAVGPCVPNGDITGANGSKQGDERRPERRRTRTKSLLSLVGLRQQSTGGMSIRGGGCIGTGCGSAPGNGNPSSSTHSKLSRAGGQASISGNSRSQCPLHYCPVSFELHKSIGVSGLMDRIAL